VVWTLAWNKTNEHAIIECCFELIMLGMEGVFHNARYKMPCGMKEKRNRNALESQDETKGNCQTQPKQE
jgi:hypothetical protein